MEPPKVGSAQFKFPARRAAIIHAGAPAAAGAPAWMIAARRAGNLNCALPTLGGSMIDTCAGGLLGAQSLGSASSSRDTGAAPSTTTVAGAPTGNGDG